MVTGSRSGWISSNDLTPVCLRKGAFPSVSGRATAQPARQSLSINLSHLTAWACIDLVPCANGLGEHHHNQPLVTRYKVHNTVPTAVRHACPLPLPNIHNTWRSNSQYEYSKSASGRSTASRC
ncbi:hypothetical protein CMEL01_00905 [Colletotrichum melonis]|uniref:Uncharacterized protein n=1 Tax=Colletotrichum melonis TaxID=1209925 RepID=A0AAI9Y2L7_9PEZI|nr:hypothetical protein CMEL01_00905 [Colletotrichum melonis]